MPNQLTVTLPTGPGRTVSGLVLRDVSSVTFDLAKMVMSVMSSNNPNNPYSEYDFDSAATVTFTISGQNSTIAVSS